MKRSFLKQRYSLPSFPPARKVKSKYWAAPLQDDCEHGGGGVTGRLRRFAGGNDLLGRKEDFHDHGVGVMRGLVSTRSVAGEWLYRTGKPPGANKCFN